MYATLINQIIQANNITHLLDYGCGERTYLKDVIEDPPDGFVYQAYDPGVPRFSGDPVPAELVVCSDVLEHVEPQYIDDVFDHLEELTEVILLATLATKPAQKTLSDGRNAHLIQQPMQWWLPKFFERFDIQTVQVLRAGHFFVIANRCGLEIDGNYT